MIPPEMARGLRMLRTFEGRDSRRQFWIYAAGLFVVTFALSFVLNVAVVALAFLVGPDAIVPVLAPVILTLTAVLAVATVGLHAAAVTRRLHDRGHTGWWGVPPVALLAVGLGIMAVLFTSVNESSEPPLALFLTGFGVNVLYLVALAVLIVQLALPSKLAPDASAAT